MTPLTTRARSFLQKEWPALLILLASALFLVLSTRTDPEGGDSAELIAAAFCQGIPHATGYPLYTWLGGVSQLLPGLSPAHAMNLSSALFASGALFLLALAGRELRGRMLAPAIAAATLALGHPFWFVATFAEVYALHAFLFALTLFLLFRWRRTGNDRVLLLATYAAALDATHHGSALLFAPGYAVLVLLSLSILPAPKRILVALLLVPVAFTVFAHHPIRNGADPAINAFDEIQTKVEWGLVDEEVAGTTFAERFRYKLSGAGPKRKLSWFGETAAEMFPRFPDYFRGSLGTLFLSLGIAGLLRGVFIGPRGESLLLVFLFGVNTVFYGNFNSMDWEDFLVPSSMILAAGAGILLEDVRRLLESLIRHPLAGRSLGFAGLVALAGVNARDITKRAESALGYQHAQTTISSERAIMTSGLDQGAHILMPWGRASFLRYLQAVEGLRPDLHVHSLSRKAYASAIHDLVPPEVVYSEDISMEIRRQYHVVSAHGLFEVRAKSD